MPEQKGIFNVHVLASYLYSKNPHISPLKLQKSLYFLFAYFGAFYSEEVIGEGISEGVALQSKVLFNANFEAWQYGPVIKEVYTEDKYGEGYSTPEKISHAVLEVEKEPEVKKFIDEMFEQFDAVSDFKLVDRSHQDLAWQNAYKKGQSSVMDNEEIIREYRDYYE